jgi:hypothetical protein
MVLRYSQTRAYQSDRASRTASRTATHPADHNPERPTQMREINDPHLTTRSPYQVWASGVSPLPDSRTAPPDSSSVRWCIGICDGPPPTQSGTVIGMEQRLFAVRRPGGLPHPAQSRSETARLGALESAGSAWQQQSCRAAWFQLLDERRSGAGSSTSATASASDPLGKKMPGAHLVSASRCFYAMGLRVRKTGAAFLSSVPVRWLRLRESDANGARGERRKMEKLRARANLFSPLA